MTGLVKALTHPRVIPVGMNRALNKLLTKSLFVLLSGMLATPLFVLNILAPLTPVIPRIPSPLPAHQALK